MSHAVWCRADRDAQGPAGVRLIRALGLSASHRRRKMTDKMLPGRATDAASLYLLIATCLHWEIWKSMIGRHSTVVDNMASSLQSGKQTDPRLSSKRERSAMSRSDDKVVEIDTLRAFTIPKMKKAKHGLSHCIFFLSWLENPVSK